MPVHMMRHSRISFIVAAGLATTLLMGTGCETWSKRMERDRAISLLDHGVRLHAGGDPKAAITSYERILSLSSDPEMKAAALGNTGLALMAIEDPVAAQAKFEEALQLTQHQEIKARALNNIGEALQKQGMPDAARTKYTEALRLTTHPDLKQLINKRIADLES